ncbi:MAG TPA: hypothetical protein VG389_20690 [Myxococcota bacterium]|jgi:hypothetical protein|nr:hypothetical protein [Myxococcota bacterium]
MGAFAQYLESHGIKPEHLARISERIERAGDEDARTMAARAKARAEKKSYAELTLAKPASGRGVSLYKISEAMADRPLPKRVRAKLLRAVRKAAKGEAVEAKALFGDVARRKGLRRIADATKKAGQKKAG